jgi:hypothetical protein
MEDGRAFCCVHPKATTNVKPAIAEINTAVTIK